MLRFRDERMLFFRVTLASQMDYPELWMTELDAEAFEAVVELTN